VLYILVYLIYILAISNNVDYTLNTYTYYVYINSIGVALIDPTIKYTRPS